MISRCLLSLMPEAAKSKIPTALRGGASKDRRRGVMIIE
jgi:hypothetical protein